jgi:hypothetical protein
MKSRNFSCRRQDVEKKNDFNEVYRFAKMDCVEQRSCKRRLETNEPSAALLPGPVTSSRSLQNAGKKEKILIWLAGLQR